MSLAMEIAKGSYAASGVLPKILPELSTFFMYQLLPHLVKNLTSLQPAYHMKGDRQFVDIVIGVPTVKRDKESYLTTTLTHLLNGLTDPDWNSTLIVVMVGEKDLETVIRVAIKIEMYFFKAVKDGLIEVISPSPAYYPNMETLPTTLGDSRKRSQWRTKQNLDALYLIAYARTKGNYYLMLEDDVITNPNYIQAIKHFTEATTSINPEWFYIEFCPVGGIGKFFRSEDLGHFMAYIQLFYYNMPIDWLLESYIVDRKCTIDKSSMLCAEEKVKTRPKYPHPLFQHIGQYSTLKGKIHNIKDALNYGVPTYYGHDNPRLRKVWSGIEHMLGHTIEKAYEGKNYFWGTAPKKGSIIEFIFKEPTALISFRFRSGNVQHTADKFYDTVVEILPFNGNGNYIEVGKFDESGLAEGALSVILGPLESIRLRVDEDSTFWVVLSEIELIPVLPLVVT